MGNWRKLLKEMALDDRPTNYTYSDASRVLINLGFTLAPQRSGSHRTWRLERKGLPSLVVGLVENGHGKLKTVYIKKMISTLGSAGLLDSHGGVDDAVVA
jgi:hypothetical protein